ncbi:hypothetical protein EFK50_20200 [Nocardioides marmoriginsengisoli]|uniref:Uncharacterized protein n=1 Tax=Nocardioides marmoriginsengisoli TaxID=661483 RepID=A0A3N0CB37_9ACTN|nr:hypothetical protein [Nocardioides marmoriginsengisoli]RNL60638.1 hypothetical protein EFK50_20200 [Nocardioides marmoriginsengisoli]
MVGKPRFLVVVIVLVAFLVATMLGAAYDYSLGLVLSVGVLAIGWAVLLNLRPDGRFLVRLLLIVPLALGVAVIAGSASEGGRSPTAPFLVLASTTAVHLAVLMGARRFGGH